MAPRLQCETVRSKTIELWCHHVSSSQMTTEFFRISIYFAIFSRQPGLEFLIDNPIQMAEKHKDTSRNNRKKNGIKKSLFFFKKKAGKCSTNQHKSSWSYHTFDFTVTLSCVFIKIIYIQYTVHVILFYCIAVYIVRIQGM